MTRSLAAAAVVLAALAAPTSALAQDDLTILVTAQARVDDVAQRLRDTPSLEAEVSTSPISGLTADLLAQYDVVVVWTHQALTDGESARIGDLLADHVDRGGAVVELVFAQLEPNPDIQGRWRSRGNSAVSSTGRDGVFTAGSLGTVAVQGHPIMEGVRAFTAERNRSGTGATVLPGAQLVASYDDGQLLVATREDRPGRVAWLGFYPGDASKLQGDWERMIANAAGWAGQPVTAHAGGPYAIDEGTPMIDLDASGSGDNAVRFTWDLDADGVFDDAEGPLVEFDTTGLDGPGSYAVWVQVEDDEGRIGQANAAVIVSNVAPVIESAAPEQARLGMEYTYTPRLLDPAGALDPLTLTLTQGPDGSTISEGTVRWSATEVDLGGEFPFSMTVDDGDGGTDMQEWVVVVQVADADGDGVLDIDDNCPGLHNPEQYDLDSDGIGDKCDTDIDNDGLDRREEVENFTDERNPDTDGDGINDGDEVHVTMTDPASRDTDDDGLDDGDELRLGTDAGNPDTDGDGLPDGDEVIRGTDPLTADSDGDGVSDGDEVNGNSNPLDPNSTPTGGGGAGDDLPPQGDDGCGCQSAPARSWLTWLQRR